MFWVRLSLFLGLFNSFVMIEEFVIDRYDLWVHLPLYREGHPCVYDLIAAALFLVIALRVRLFTGGVRTGNPEKCSGPPRIP